MSWRHTSHHRLHRLQTTERPRVPAAVASFGRSVLILALAGSPLACQRGNGLLEIWVVAEPGAGVAAEGELGVSGEVAWSTNQVRLAGAGNETLSFRFAVRPTDRPVEQPNLGVRTFRAGNGRIESSAVRLFRMHPVSTGRWPGWHIRSLPPERRNPRPMDVLVPVTAPRGGLPAILKPGKTYHFWADVGIPKPASPGIYTSKIELMSGEETLGGLDVQLLVWPFILPDLTDVAVIGELDHSELVSHHIRNRGRPYRLVVDDWRHLGIRDELDALLGSTMRLLEAHRVTPVLHKLAPIVRVSAGGGITLDWGQYDLAVGSYLNGRAFFSRVPVRYWPVPLQNIPLAGASREALASPAMEELLRSYSSKSAAHFDEMGWLDRAYAMVPGVLVPGQKAIETTRRFKTLADAATKPFPVVSQLFPQDLAPYGWVDYPYSDFSDAVDVWAPLAQFYDARVMAGQRAEGRRTWLTVDRPPFSGTLEVHAPSTYVRILTWQAAALGAEVLYIGEVNRWPDAKDSPVPVDCVQVDPSVLLYPGSPYGLEEPVPSVRLKHLRRSLQDAAYTELLAEHGLDHIVETLRSALTLHAGTDAYRTHFADGKPSGWADDQGLFEAARHIMAEALIKSAYDDRKPSRSEELASNTAWRRFMLEARSLQVRVDGTRLRMMGPHDAAGAEAECSIRIVNHTRVPVSGTVRFEDLPGGWSAAIDGHPFPAIAPNGTRRVKLVARATSLPGESGGFLSLPILLTTEDGTIRRFTARLSALAAIPRQRPIEIDGDLSDWPVGTGNVAADFVLITGESMDESVRMASRPRFSTTGFVLRDRDDLYIALNCEAGQQANTPTSRRKRVRYEDMIPMGEELVEVLIDPLNAGTRSPSDIFHVVVKRTGTDVTEKGIRFDPPCGKREAWAADVEVATAVGRDRWIAELRIPLKAFGPVTREGTIWGLNLTRYDAANQEFSTWSGAVRNAYDPLSMGNLYLP